MTMGQGILAPILEVSKMSLKGISNLLKIPRKEAAKLGLSWGHGSSLSISLPSN